MKLRLHPKAITLYFAIACIVTASLGMAVYWQTHQLVGSFDSVSESHLILEKFQDIQTLMEAAESSVCAYVITGDPATLSGYHQAHSTVPALVKKLDTLFSRHPYRHQKKTLRRLQKFLSAHFDFLDNVVAVRKSHGYEAAAKWIQIEDYATTREEMKDLLAEVKKKETSMVRQRYSSTSEHSSKTNTVLILAIIMSCGILALVFNLLHLESGRRRRVEETNETLEHFLSSIIERIPYMVLVKEAKNLRLTLVNKAATEWLGRSEEDLLGSNEYDLLLPEEAEAAMEKDRDLLREGEAVDIPEETFVRAGKDIRILHTQKLIIPNATGSPAYLLCISEDITEQKHAERMLQLSRDKAVQSERLKSEFMRNMSHEIRTPISVFLGMISLLLDTKLDEEQRMLAVKSSRAANNLLQLTKDILDFSKIETGTFSLQLQEMNATHHVESVLAMWKEQAQVKGLQLQVFIPHTLPTLLYGDSVRLRQVLTHLMGNAVKFTSKGEITVSVSPARETPDQVWLTYRIRDTGIGIPPEVQQHLFEPFRQGDGSPTRRYGGTGLGLAIAKRIVELLGGDITLEHSSEKGSTFSVTLPFRKHPPAQNQDQTLQPLAARARVLVIDDDPMVCQLLHRQLIGLAMACETVGSGEAALHLLLNEKKAGHPFSLVLLDTQLADTDGVTFAQSVMKEPALAGIKLLIMTHGQTPLDPAASARLGIAGWVSKPPTAEALQECLASLVNFPQDNQKRVA